MKRFRNFTCIRIKQNHMEYKLFINIFILLFFLIYFDFKYIHFLNYDNISSLIIYIYLYLHIANDVIFMIIIILFLFTFI